MKLSNWPSMCLNQQLNIPASVNCHTITL